MGEPQSGQDSQDKHLAIANVNLNSRFSLNLNSLSSTSIPSSSYHNSDRKDGLAPIGHDADEVVVVAPPPPGFVDDTDQYYLPDEDEDKNSG